jgi:prepilin-type N-terminal cleavage/methylation domain-containing protein
MKNKHSAFSLIELSIVILIIGILVAGVTQGSRLVAQMRLSTAKNLTDGSPVSSIKGLVTWLETTKDSSMDDAEEEDGLEVTNWYDINPQLSTKNNVASSVGPLYKAKCINNLPCLQFNGATSSRYLNSTQNYGTTTTLTIFAVFNVNVTGITHDLVVTRGAFAANDNSFTYAAHSTNTVYYRSTNTGAVNSFTGTIAANNNYIAGVVDNNVNAVHYLNGAANSTAAVNGVKSLNIFTIGAWDNAGSITEAFNGNISEIIIFDRNLKDEERISIQKYLSQKWGIKVS